MKRLFLYIFILLVSISCQKEIKDDTSFVDDSNSKLLQALLMRSDFDENWKLGYGEIGQHLGGTKIISADEHAYYFLATTYTPEHAYFTFSHGLYAHVNIKVDPYNLIERVEVDYAEKMLLARDLALPNYLSRCIQYESSSKQDCFFVKDYDYFTSALQVTAPANFSDNQIINIIGPILKKIESRAEAYEP